MFSKWPIFVTILIPLAALAGVVITLNLQSSDGDLVEELQQADRESHRELRELALAGTRTAHEAQTAQQQLTDQQADHSRATEALTQRFEQLEADYANYREEAQQREDELRLSNNEIETALRQDLEREQRDRQLKEGQAQTITQSLHERIAALGKQIRDAERAEKALRNLNTEQKDHLGEQAEELLQSRLRASGLATEVTALEGELAILRQALQEALIPLPSTADLYSPADLHAPAHAPATGRDLDDRPMVGTAAPLDRGDTAARRRRNRLLHPGRRRRLLCSNQRPRGGPPRRRHPALAGRPLD